MSLIARTVPAGVLLVVAAACATGPSESPGADRSATPPLGRSTPEPTSPGEASPPRTRIPAAPSHLSVVHLVGGEVGRLRVSGETVPGRWMLNNSRGDVWVAMKVGLDERQSAWWGKGATPHPVPGPGAVLPGGVVISPDSHWIAWTRPTRDVDDPNPPRVLEVVDTATGKVRWSRNAGGDASEPDALAVTDDGVVVFAHCAGPGRDRRGGTRCDAARVDAWAPEVGATATVPAGVRVERSGPPGLALTSLRPLVQTTGAHNGLLVHRTPSGPARYVRVSARGEVDVVATLPPRTAVVTADESYAVVPRGCRQSARRCRWIAVPLAGGQRRPLQGIHGLDPYEGTRAMLYEGFASFVAERDDLVVVQSRLDASVGRTLARCSLAQARCVRTTSSGGGPR